MAGGRPTKYKPEYCDEIVEFFTRKPFEPLIHNDAVVMDKNGNPVMTPCPLPTKEGFAIKIGVDPDTLGNWAKAHEKFFGAVKKAEARQKEILIQNGLMGNYEKVFAIFVAKNVTDMRDRKEIEITENDLTPWSDMESDVDG